MTQRTSTCLWFDGQAREAAEFYVSLFPNSRIVSVNYFLEGAPRPAGSVLTVRFLLDGTEYVALDGGPEFQFTPAMSIVVYCDTQDEVDRLWRALGDRGQPGQCGWLTDRFGVSWQIVPRTLIEMLGASDKAAAQRAFTAMMEMTKLDVAALKRAYAG